MAYSFDQVFAADPANPSNIAQNASILIYAPGDATKTPLVITDPSGGALSNPVTVNANGFGPAFAHATLDRVAWDGGGFTGFFTSYEGMKNEAVAARDAAQEAATTAGTEAAAVATAAIGDATADAEAAAVSAAAAADNAAASATAAATSASLVGAPADTAMATVANNTSSAFRGALNATILTGANAAIGASPVVSAKVPNAIGLTSGAQRGDIQFVRTNGGNPVFTQATQNPSGTAATPTTSGSIYWPYVVDARAALGNAALDEFYMYYSTDHELTHSLSGIWLATGPTELGPWTGRGRVYIDNTGGLQTETASVIWNPDENLFFMYYQQAHATGGVGDQQTCLATSPDGITWTRVGIVIDIVAGTVPGDGHCGYFKPFRIGGQWVGYHLMGGGDYPHFGISRSADGRTWWTEHNPLSYGADQVQPRRIEWNTTDIIWWRGRFWWIGQLSDFVSGATPKDSRIAVAPLATDQRHIIGVPKIQLYPTAGTETTNYRSQSAFVGRDGQLYLYYQCGNSFFAAIAQRSAV